MPDYGFVQLRRGVLEHVEDGRMTSDEFAAFVYITAKADHRTGSWKGCGEMLARAMHWCVRKGQYILAALAKKGYIGLQRLRRHYGAYFVCVGKYRTAQPDAPITQDGASRCADPPKTAHPSATLQEVNLQENTQQGGRGYASRKAGRRHTQTSLESIIAIVQDAETARRSTIRDLARLRDGAGRSEPPTNHAPGPHSAKAPLGVPATAAGVT